MQDIYFLEERWNKAWSVKDVCTRNISIKEHLLFFHSWSGCDLTSAVFGKGKPKVPQMLAKSNEWKHLAETVSSLWSSQVDVGNASIQALVLLYGGKDCSSLVHSVAFSSLRNCYRRVVSHCATSIVCHSCSSSHTFISSNI